MTDLITAALALPAEERGSLARLLIDSLKKESPESLQYRTDIVIDKVCEHTGITRKEVLSKRRHRNIVESRHMIIYLMRKYTRYSLGEIGSIIGDRDHTTALYAIRTVEALCFSDKSFCERLKLIDSHIKQALS